MERDGRRALAPQAGGATGCRHGPRFDDCAAREVYDANEAAQDMAGAALARAREAISWWNEALKGPRSYSGDFARPAQDAAPGSVEGQEGPTAPKLGGRSSGGERGQECACANMLTRAVVASMRALARTMSPTPVVEGVSGQEVERESRLMHHAMRRPTIVLQQTVAMAGVSTHETDGIMALLPPGNC